MFDEAPKYDGPVETKSVKDVSTEPLDLPAGFEWVVLDIAEDD